MRLPSRRVINLAGFVACAGLIAYALYAEHVLMYVPCPLCILQRIAVILLGIAFLAAAFIGPGATARKVCATLVVLPGLFGIGVAGWHVWKQLQPPDPMASCGAGLDYMLDTLPLGRVLELVFTGPGDCAAIDWSLLGLSMPAWVLIALTVLTAAGVWNNLRRA
jgi:disulfide bond formation protein DsbB